MFYYNKTVVMDRIVDTISENLDTPRLLDEWVSILNNHLPSSRKKNHRQYGRMFSVMERQGTFGVERQVNPSQYCFSEA